MHLVIIWQRFLPYHIARIRHLWNRISPLGYRLSAIEVASEDESYEFPKCDFTGQGFEHICCFPKVSYHKLRPRNIHKSVFNILFKLKPDVIFAPATPLPEGMAAYAYRLVSGCRFMPRTVQAWFQNG